MCVYIYIYTYIHIHIHTYATHWFDPDQPFLRSSSGLNKRPFNKNPSAAEVKEKLQQHGEEGYSLFCFRTADLFFW